MSSAESKNAEESPARSADVKISGFFQKIFYEGENASHEKNLRNSFVAILKRAKRPKTALQCGLAVKKTLDNHANCHYNI